MRQLLKFQLLALSCLGASMQPDILSPTRPPIPPSRLALILNCFFLYHSRLLAHRISGMTKRNSRVLGLLLSTVMAALSVAGQPAAPMTGVASRPAGCHQHGAKPPATAPLSYSCCQSGHNSAILPASLASPTSPGRVATAISIPALIAVPKQGFLRSSTIPSPDPPLAIPLRV